MNAHHTLLRSRTWLAPTSILLGAFCLLLTAPMAEGGLLGGGDARFTVTYRSPTDSGVLMTVEAPDPTDAPLFVDVCSAGKWERAAVLGHGLVRVGNLIVPEQNNLASNPDAVRLSDRADIILLAGQRQKFRIGSNPRLTNWNTASLCSVTVALNTEPGTRYRATWHYQNKACSMAVAAIPEGASGDAEKAVPGIEADGSCSIP
jgi:hypothetical protein